MNEPGRKPLGSLLLAWRDGDLREEETEELLRRLEVPRDQDLFLEECLLTASILESLREARALRRERARRRPLLLLPTAAAAGILLTTAILLLRSESRPAAIVRDTTGEVSLLSNGRKIPARSGAAVSEEGGLETSPTASAAVLFPDGTRLDLGASTAIEDVRSLPAKRLRLSRGEIRARVAPQPPGYPMEIETPQVFIRVIGTALRLKVSPAASRLEVTEGAASMTRRTDGKSVEVPAGSFAVAAEGTDLSARPLTGGPWGIACGAPGFGDHPRLFPLLRQAGIPRVRLFPDWASLQPANDRWDWTSADVLLRSAREHGIEISGLLTYPAPGVSPATPGDQDPARPHPFPRHDWAAWKDFVRAAISRYVPSICCWEVDNELHSDSVHRGDAAKNYAERVRLARQAAPGGRIGINCTEADLAFLEETIRAGAGGHFDFVAVHPYALAEAVAAGREPVFLRLAPNLRRMLARTGQRPDIELWISGIGLPCTPRSEEERLQAEVLVKVFVLSLAQEFERVFWFEGRGPVGDFGILREDGSKRPSFEAFRVTTHLLGSHPEYLGWFSPTGRHYGFVFMGSEGPVLIAWATGNEDVLLRWEAPVRVTNLQGGTSELKAGQDLSLTRVPVFITDLPAGLAAAARAKRDQPFPWTKDFSRAGSVVWQPEAPAAGLEWFEREDGRGVAGIVDGVPSRRTNIAGRSYYLYFDVDDSYASLDDPDIEIAVTARRADPSRNAGCNLLYESTHGYRLTDEWWTVPPSPRWHTHVFRLRDAYFANGWGYNFRVSALGSEGDLWVSRIVVRRASGR